MNSKPNSMSTPLRRRIGTALLTVLAALALALTVPARAGTQPAAIPISDIGARARANYQGDALGVTATPDGARLRCGFQKLEGHATPEGLWLESTKPGAAGRLRVTATAFSRGDLSTLNPQPSTVLATTGTVSVEDKLVRFTRPGLTEEYSVSVDGVRQDFIIESPPLNPSPSTLNPQPSTLNHFAGALRVELALSGARAEATACGARLRLDGSGRALAYSRLRAEDATGRELTARLEVLSADRLAVSVADANATYPVRIDPTFSDANWVSLGSGMNYPVRALAVSGTDLYAGGYFYNAGGVSANGIAKWDGNAWSALGSGMGGGGNYVFALTVSGTNLYAGGCFDTAGGVTANCIAKWDGSAWSALGSGMTLQLGSQHACVYALAVSGTNLYAGGLFTTAGGVTASSIARWDGSAWSALGSGMNGYYGVSALAVSGTDLYAGGGFTNAGGVPVNGIAKWDGSAWSALSSGVGGYYVYCGCPPDQRVYHSGYVGALAVSGTNLYAGGAFTNAGGVTASNIAKWDGSDWSALGSGIDGGVYALAVSGTSLYAGGLLWTAGGVPASNIAKWDGSAWSALGSGVSGGFPIWGSQEVSSLAADGAGHLFVGGNFSLAGTNVSFCIAQANLGSSPTILKPALTQTAEAGATMHLTVDSTGDPPPSYQWYLNGTNLLDCASSELVLNNLLLSQSGTYTVVVTNVFGAVTSAPVMVNVIQVVERRPAARVKLIGEAGNLLNVEYVNSLSATPNWLPLDTVTLVSTSQYCFDASEPLPPQRFYRAWQMGTPGVVPSLSLSGIVPAITLTGAIGHSVRLDYINQFGPIDAWVTLATVQLTNTSQLYFDVSAHGQPSRLYRVVPLL